jgi:hypothetical protein
MASELTRIGVSLSKEGYRRLSALATELESSQSALIESLVWLISDNAETKRTLNLFIKDRAKVEEDLIALARSNPAEAKKLLAKVSK